MADVVENRIVEMEFDNKDFEQGVATSLSTLEKLKEALQFNNSSKGFTELQNSIKSIDFSPIESSLQSLEGGFMTLLGSLKRNFFDQLSNNILNLGTQLYQNTIGQIKSGGQRRAMNIEQAKFKISGLGEDWDTVYKDMDYAVSGTAYGIDQAANAASQFLASGVQAGDDMKAALRGISGIAAMTSADYDEIANIFTAAAGKGKVQAMELNRISQRGVNAAAAIAQQMGTTEEAVRDMASKGELDFNTFATAMDSAFGEHAKKANETFTGSMSNMKAALSRIGEIFYAPYLEAMIPVFNRLREVIDKFKNAMKAEQNSDKESVATKIADLYKKLSELFIAWTQTWEPRLEKLPQKMEKWFIALDYIGARVDRFKTVLEDVYNGVAKITKSAEKDLGQLTEQEEQAARDIWILGNWGNGEERRKNLEAAGMSYERVQGVVNQIVEGTYKWDKWLFKAAGVAEDTAEAYDIHSWAVNAILNAYKTVRMVIDTVEAGMQKLFKIFRAAYRGIIDAWSSLTNLSKEVGSPIQEAIQLIRILVRNFKIAGDRADNIQSTFKGFFALIKLGSYILASFLKALQKPMRELAKGQPIISSITGSTGELIYNWVEAIMTGDKIPKIMDKISTAVSFLVSKLNSLGDGKFSIKSIFTKIVDTVKAAITTIKKLMNGETTFGEVFKSILDKIKKFVAQLRTTSGEIEGPLSDIFTKIKDFVTKVMDFLGPKLFGEDFNFSEWFGKIFSKDEVTEQATKSKGALPAISDRLNTITDQTDNLWVSIKRLITSIVDGVTSVFRLISTAVNGLGEVFGSIFTFVSKIFNIGSTGADGMSQNFQAFADFVSTCFIVARDVVWSIKDPLKEIVEAIANIVSSITGMFAGIASWIGDSTEQAYGAAALFALIKLVDKIMDYKILKAKGTTDSVLYSIATFFDDMRGAAEAWKNDRLDKIAESIGKSLLLIAGSMVLIMGMLSGKFIGTSTEKAMGLALQSFIYISLFMWEIVGILALAKNVFDKPLDLSFLMVAFKGISMAMLFITLGISAVMASASKLTTGQIIWIMSFIMLIIAEVFAGVGALVYLISKWSIDEKTMASVTVFMTAFAKAIKMVMKGITGLMAVMMLMVLAQGNDPNAWDNVADALVGAVLAAAAIMIAMGGAFALMFINGDKMPDSKQFAMLALLLIVYAGCIRSVMNSLIVLVTAMALADSADVIGAVSFLGIFTIVLAALVAGAVLLLNKVNDPASIMKGLLGIAALIMVFGDAIKNIAIACAIISASGVTDSQLERMLQITGVISLLVIVLAAIAAKTASGGSILSFAAGVVALALSIYLVNRAILYLAEAVTLLIGVFVGLAEIWPTIADRIPKMLDDLGVQLPKFLEIVRTVLKSFAEIAIEVAPLIGEAIAVVIATVISVSWQYIPKVVANFLAMLDTVCDLLIDGSETILPKLLLLLFIFIAYLDANAVALGYLLADVLMKVIWGALMAIGDFLKDTVFPWLVRKIGDIFADGRESLADAISDAALGGKVEEDDAIVLRETTEINQTTGTHFRYYNPVTDTYYDTLEEAQNAELDEALAKNKEKADKSIEVNGETITNKVQIDNELIENTKSSGSFKDSKAYKEAMNTEGYSDTLNKIVGGISNSVTTKFGETKKETTAAAQDAGYATGEAYEDGLQQSTVDNDAYIRSLQHQSEMAGEVSGKSYKTGWLSGAGTNSEMMEELIGSQQIEIPEYSNADVEALRGKFSNLDTSVNTDFDGTFAINTETDDTYAQLNNISDGTTKVQMDTTEMSDVIQNNTDSTKEQISMLDKVKSTLDELKTSLKDCIVMPKGTNIDTTFMLDKQVLGRELTPVVNTINRTNSQKSDRRLASTK